MPITREWLESIAASANDEGFVPAFNPSRVQRMKIEWMVPALQNGWINNAAGNAWGMTTRVCNCHVQTLGSGCFYGEGPVHALTCPIGGSNEKHLLRRIDTLEKRIQELEAAK